MRRKIHLLLPFLLLAFVFIACDETKEEDKYANWRERNEAFVDSLQNVVDKNPNGELKALKDSRTGTNVFYKIFPGKEGDTGRDRAYLTSKVDIYYRGMLIDEAVFSAAPNEKYYTRLYENLFVFDSTFKGKDPDPVTEGTRTNDVTNFVSGWIEILQWMYPGARWEIYIPYKSAYGSSANGEIPAYSTLIFDITLVDIDYFPAR